MTRGTLTKAGPQSKRGRRRPRQSMNTHANLSHAKRRRGRRSSPAIWLETFPAAPLTFGSSSNLKATRSPHWKSFREGWLQSRVFTGMNGRFAHPETAHTDREFGSLVSDPH